MSHVSVKGFPAGDHEENGAKDNKSFPAIFQKETQAVKWVDGRQDAWGRSDAFDSKNGQRQKPNQGHATKDVAHFARAKALDGKQRDQNRDRDWNNVRFKKR